MILFCEPPIDQDIMAHKGTMAQRLSVNNAYDIVVRIWAAYVNLNELVGLYRFTGQLAEADAMAVVTSFLNLPCRWIWS